MPYPEFEQISQGTQAMASQFLLGHVSDRTVIRLTGRGTMQESPTFHTTVEPYLKAGGIILDLTCCDYLDSTFLGCLVGIKKRCEHGLDSRLLIAAPAATRTKLFASSSLDRYFDFIDECPEASDQFTPIDVPKVDRDDLARHVMGCHERLAAVGGSDSAAFQAIADRLAKECERSPQSDDLRQSTD